MLRMQVGCLVLRAEIIREGDTLFADRGQLRAALGEERATTKNLKRQVEAAVAQQQRMAQNFEAMLMQMAAGTYRPPAAPGQPGSQPGVQPPAQGQPAGFRPIDLASIEANPLGALQQIAEMANAMQAQRAAEEAQRQRVQQQQQQAHYAQQQYIAQVSQVAAQMEDHEEEFRAVAPDYDDAAGFYVEHRMKELIVQGYSEERAYKAVEYEIINGAATALQQRLNPAKALYEAAKLRGFTGPRPMAVSPPAPHQPPAQVAPFPAVAAPVAPPAGQPPAADPLAGIRAGQQAATSLSAPGGGAVPDGASLANVLSLSGAAFASASERFLKEMSGR